MSRIGGLFRKFRRSKPGAGQQPPGEQGAIQWVVAGLGNPDEEYRHSRHNLGFLVMDHMAERSGLGLSRHRFKALYAENSIGDRQALLVKPQTYYNLSGVSLAAILGYFKVPVERLIVVHDDLDLDWGRLRLKRGGGDAGNRGVRSIAETLGTPEFIRVRIGIGRPPGESNSKDYVLRPMKAGELREAASIIGLAAEAVEAIVVDTLERAMDRYNQRI